MLFTLSISLYTSRIVLDRLGVNDYGVYSLIAGFVMIFSFFNSAMTATTQRFLAYDIGENNIGRLKKTFNATINIHIGISFLFLLLSETIGLWFINTKLNLPDNRIEVINWVYQFSIFTFVLAIIQVPYEALIVAREKMKIYALFSVIDTVLKLVVAYLIGIASLDGLITYSFLLLAASLIVRLSQKIYCKKNFNETKYNFFYDKEYYKVILSYSGWSLFGNVAAVAKGQGINVVLNIFFGTAVNAAYGITLQVQNAVQAFVNNFQMAANPQIIKYYAAGDKELCVKLILRSSKYSFFLVFILAFPIITNIEFILESWLFSPPQHTSTFIVLCLINLLIEVISGPLMIGAQATGQIKWYQIIIGTLIFLNLPLSYIVLRYQNLPEIVFLISILISVLALLFRLYFLKINLDLSIRDFLYEVFFKILVTSSSTIILFHGITTMIKFENNFTHVITKIMILIIISIFAIFKLGLDGAERSYFKQFIFKIIIKK